MAHMGGLYPRVELTLRMENIEHVNFYIIYAMVHIKQMLNIYQTIQYVLNTFNFTTISHVYNHNKIESCRFSIN